MKDWSFTGGLHHQWHPSVQAVGQGHWHQEQVGWVRGYLKEVESKSHCSVGVGCLIDDHTLPFTTPIWATYPVWHRHILSLGHHHTSADPYVAGRSELPLWGGHSTRQLHPIATKWCKEPHASSCCASICVSLNLTISFPAEGTIRCAYKLPWTARTAWKRPCQKSFQTE